MRLRHHSSRISTPVALLLLLGLVAAIQVAIAPPGRPATPGAGSIGPSPAPSTLTWTGPSKSAIQSDHLTGHNTKAESDATCTADQAFCDDFTLTVTSDTTYWVTHDGALEIGISWANPANDFDLYVFDSSGAQVDASGDPGNVNAENVSIDQPVGTYLVRASYYSVLEEGYEGTATFRSEDAIPPPPPVDPPGALPTFGIYPAPTGVGESAGEPTLGVNHETGKVMYIAGTETLQVSFDDCASPASATWLDKTPPTQAGISLDPILFTDSEAAPTDVANRCFNSQLLGKAAELHYSDDDGETWTRSQGNGLNSGVDHQTIGGGPYRPNSGLPLPGQAYPRAIYYCSQDAADANCARSDTGGLTFGPAVPMYTLAQCLGIHGHVKVAPDGTVYVPNKACAKDSTGILFGLGQTVVVSEDNGTTWNVRTPTEPSSAGDTDPSVGIAKDGTLYMGYVNGDGIPRVAVSSDKAETWARDADVGAQLGIKNAVFPAAVAGDGDRAAVAFLGTTTGGDYEDQANFKGVWHVYLATTFDGGASWNTVDLTPNDPVQRGSICTSGTTCDNTPDDRNLLDFMDATLDAQGRVLVAYADGCVGACVAGGPNSFTDKATIARQRAGLRMVAAFDEAGPSGEPGAPGVTLRRDNSVTARLSWTVPEPGASPILGYRVYRSTQKDAGYTLLAQTALTKYEDRSGDPGVEYWYRVTAFNVQGEGPNCREVGTVDVPLSETPCTGNGITTLVDGTGDALTTQKQHDLQRIAIAEPFVADATDHVVFTMKVAAFDQAPTAGTSWPILFTRTSGTTPTTRQGYRVAMQTNGAGAVTYVVQPVPFTATGAYGTPGTAQPADSGSFATDGTIRIKVSTSKLGGAVPGDTFSDFLTRIQTVVITPDNGPDSLAPGGTPYVLVGNNFCRPNRAPVADLDAFPASGPAPLDVGFDAMRSTDPDGDAITSYTFDFGDGTPPETNDTGTIRHTYMSVGEFRARVRVNDARGLLSANVAAAVIEVTPPPAQTSDLSVKKVADNPETPSGGIVTWTVTVTNLGPASATGVAITDFLPEGVQVQSASTPAGDCVLTGNRLRCPVGNLAKDSSAAAVIRAQVSETGPLTNSASATGDQTDLDDTNSSDAVTSNVTSPGSPPPADDPPADGSGQTTSPSGSGSTPAASGSQAESSPPPPSRTRVGYTLVAADGGIFNFGTAFHGSTGDIRLARPIVGMANQPDDRGYRFVAADGGVFNFGNATFQGSVRSALNGGFPGTPVTSMAVTPSGDGYWVVTRGGDVFAFGDAPTIGSFSANATTGAVVAIVGTASGRGYWIVTEHGEVERFGDAPDVGSVPQSLGGRRPRLPIVAAAISAGGRGLLLAAGDGGVFSLGDAPFEGSLPEVLGGRLPNQPITGMSATPTGRGYWLVAADGGVFSFGDAPFLGSMGDVALNLPVVGMSSLR